MNRALSVLVFLFACGVISAAEPLGDIDIPYEKHVLPNGLTLIIHEDHKAPVVAVNVWYHVGSKDEKPGRTGFAHLFEHLMFNGSENHNTEYWRTVGAVGGTKMNGTTWLDRTNYFQNVPTSGLDVVLWLESDRMGHLLGAIDQGKLDEQRGVVQNEKRQRENQPYGKVDELIAANTYPTGHPYSWLTIGSMEDLNAASLEDVKNWFRTYYGAANAVLVIAGDVRAAEVQQKVEHWFSDIPPGPVIQRQRSWVAKMSGERRASVQDRVPQARLYKTWNIPGYATREFTLLDVTADLLGGGKNSRLYKRLVYTDQTVTAVEASVGPFEIGSQLQVMITVKPGGDVKVVERALDEEIARFLRQGPTREELDRVRTMRRAAFVRATERIDGFGGKSSILAHSEVYGGSPDFYQRMLGWEREATVADIRAVAQQWLADGVFVAEVEPTPEYRVVANGADRSHPPTASAPPALQLPPLRRARLSNGLEVVLAERHSAPLVEFNLIVDAGSAADSLATPGTAQLAIAMLDEGTATRSAPEIASRAEALGAQLSARATLDRSYISMNAMADRLTDSVELFTDIVTHPTFPDAELARLKAQALAAIQQEKTQPLGIATRLFPRLVYGEHHAYSNPLSGSGTAARVASLTSADLRGFHERWVRPDNATLLIVGDTTLDAVVPLLESRVAGWKAPSAPVPEKRLARVAPQSATRVFLVNRTGALQSMIVAGYAAPPRSDPDNVALRALNTIMGGSFVSRVNMNLREDKHWSYGASTRLIDAAGQGPFIVQAPVQTDRTAEAMQEIVKELREVRSARPPTEAELRHARERLVLSLPGTNETASEVASSYADILAFGLPDSYWNDFAGAVNALTTVQLKAVVDKLIQPDGLTWVVVGDLEKIEASIRKLNLGDVKVLDADGNVLR